uniref:Uncharacterized protein n=1 Tax=Arundo donax TaxID=35708 RepID=A0A0A8XSZ6_ARUDO
MEFSRRQALPKLNLQTSKRDDLSQLQHVCLESLTRQ